MLVFGGGCCVICGPASDPFLIVVVLGEIKQER